MGTPHPQTATLRGLRGPRAHAQLIGAVRTAFFRHGAGIGSGSTPGPT